MTEESVTPTVIPHQADPLSPWEKLIIMGMGALIVCITLVCVVCIVVRNCWLNTILNKEKHPKNGWCYYGTSIVKKGKEESDDDRLCLWSPKDQSSWFVQWKAATSLSTANSAEKEELHPTDKSLSVSLSSGSPEESLSCEGGITSSMSFKNALAAFALNNKSRDGSTEEKLSYITLELLWKSGNGSENGILSLTIMSCYELPNRDYGSPVDSYVRVCVMKDRGRSIRKRTRQSLKEWHTKTVRHSSNPTFEQTFVAQIPESDFKHVCLNISVFDLDRHTKTTEIGSASILLREIKLLTNNTLNEKIMTSAYLAQKKQEFGELFFGMSYLPTAQRMSFNILKAANLKFNTVCPSIETFCPYVRILQMNSNGKILRKKKTTIKKCTKEPNFNETLNFELSMSQLDSTVFVILVSQRQKSIELQELQNGEPYTSQDLNEDCRPVKDICLGRISIGRNVAGIKERALWMDVVSTPRKVFSTWQTLY